jgi:hypothetical protein
MRKFILMVLAGAALVLAVPQMGSAAPAGLVTGLATTADRVSNVDIVRHRRWHRGHWRHRHWHHRHWRWHHRHHHRWWRHHRHWR